MTGLLRRCTALAVLSELDWEVLRAVPQPVLIKDLYPWLRCELSHRHRGQHHALAQSDAKRRDWWLRWTDDATIRDRDLAILLPCATDAAVEASAETDPCLLFVAHAGPHSFQIDRHDLRPYTKPPRGGGESGATTPLARLLAAHRLTRPMADFLRELGTLEQVCGTRSKVHRGLTTATLAPQLIRVDVHTPGLATSLIDDMVRVPVPVPYAPPLGPLTPDTSVPIALTSVGRGVLAELAPFWRS
ncbi:hypothetical protein [Haloechinothrix halophila]|uniref:hypothetical protein n=1 Tax=Haloechinothrix halophila TaxID=1069073 RepID=UPI0012F84261|nr:hypothetical protein [Haloechinothrix halophila]